jgi:predicted short-subunit dehydrogenase-like oxidoreductase (DUF2520 family)
LTADFPSHLSTDSSAPGNPPESSVAPSHLETSEGILHTRGSIGIIGAGAVGSTLARVLAARGFRITAVAAGHLAHAEALTTRLPEGTAVAMAPEEVARTCDLVFLAVPDDRIEPLARRLPWHTGQSVVHLCGAKSATALAAAADSGADVAALHPLMTFPSVALELPVALLLERVQRCYWGLEAKSDALAERLRHLVATLDGHVLTVPGESRVPYHIGAVFASNYVVASLGAACALWGTFGTPPEEALQALLPLLRGAVASLAESGLPQALTGPVARGDAGTVAAHLEWLEHSGEQAPTEGSLEMLQAASGAYRELARLARSLAIQKGTITPEQARVLHDLLFDVG